MDVYKSIHFTQAHKSVSVLITAQQTVQIPTKTFCVTKAENTGIDNVISKFVIRSDAPFSAVLTSQGSDGRGEVLEVSDMNSEKVVVQKMDLVCTIVALKQRDCFVLKSK